MLLQFWPFLFRFSLYSMGMQRFMPSFYDQLDLVHEMFAFWTDFVIEPIRLLLPQVRFDLAEFAEDLALKTGTHLSLTVYKEFFLLYQNQVIAVLLEPIACKGSS